MVSLVSLAVGTFRATYDSPQGMKRVDSTCQTSVQLFKHGQTHFNVKSIGFLQLFTINLRLRDPRLCVGELTQTHIMPTCRPLKE